VQINFDFRELGIVFVPCKPSREWLFTV